MVCYGNKITGGAGGRGDSFNILNKAIGNAAKAVGGAAKGAVIGLVSNAQKSDAPAKELPGGLLEMRADSVAISGNDTASTKPQASGTKFAAEVNFDSLTQTSGVTPQSRDTTLTEIKATAFTPEETNDILRRVALAQAEREREAIPE